MSNTRLARRALAAAAAAVLVLGGGFLTSTAASAAVTTTAPSTVTKMASLGDSITQATMTCSSLIKCPANSWSTGTNTTVVSHATRLRAAGAASLVAANYSVAGANSSALLGQAQSAVTQGAKYVTIEIGANDACTSTVAGMTSRQVYRDRIRAAFAALAASPASPEIFVASIPSIQRLYELNKSSASARFAWALFKTCQSMLAKPTSNLPADIQRRTDVQTRINEYNEELAAACLITAKCRWDGGVVAGYAFSKSEVSTSDYFHPSLAGQKKLAEITWLASQWKS